MWFGQYLLLVKDIDQTTVFIPISNFLPPNLGIG
jgi:hypothetical protein